MAQYLYSFEGFVLTTYRGTKNGKVVKGEKKRWSRWKRRKGIPEIRGGTWEQAVEYVQNDLEEWVKSLKREKTWDDYVFDVKAKLYVERTEMVHRKE